MKSWMKLAFTAFALAGAGALVAGVGPVMTEARWSRYAVPARIFLNAATSGDTASLRRQAANPDLVLQILELQSRRPQLVATAAQSLETRYGMQTGDTALVSFGIEQPCPAPDLETSIDFSFLDHGFDRQVLWMRIRVCQ
jgi:hypothetical protein